MHLGDKDPRLFDYWAGYNSLMSHWTGEKYKSEYRSDFETRQAIEFLDQHGSKPFMLAVSYYPPHTPYDPPKKYEQMYADKGVDHAAYYGAVTAVDRDIGLLLRKLKDLGLERDTFVSLPPTMAKLLGSAWEVRTRPSPTTTARRFHCCCDGPRECPVDSSTKAA
jgi:arylsulfatase A-like enzyme